MSKKVKPSSRTVWGMYIGFVRKYPMLLVCVIAGGILLQVSNIVAPIFLKQFFNILASSTPNPATAKVLGSVLSFVVFFWFLDWAARRLQDTCTMFLEARVMSDILDTTFEYLLGHSYSFFLSRFSGSLTHKVNKFARAFEVLFDSIVLQFFPTTIFITGAITVLYFRNHVLGIALALWTIGFVAFQVYVSRLRQPTRVARSKAETKVTADLSDAISNQSTVILFSGVPHETERFSETVQHWREATLRSWLADAWIWSGIGLFMIAIEAGLMFGGIILWKQGLIDLGDFVLIQAYLITTFDRLVTINRELRRLYDSHADASEMVEILNTLHEVRDISNAEPLKISEGAVTFRDVSFHFNAERMIFNHLKLVIGGGEKVALVGPSGAGKSTITRLILRLHELQKGHIEIDGQNISEITQDSLRNAIAFVPQEPILFHRTLMENIRYGRRDASDEEVIEAAKQAHCHEFITAFPTGYDTYVGERGVRLSGGERQRIAIARAILKNAPILLLDEATSSLDSRSEMLIQDSLATLMKNKTVLVIAHRLSTIMKMDRIVVLDKGHVIEEGTHDVLTKSGGVYAELWSHQAGGFLLGDEPEVPEEVDEDEDEDEDESDKA